MTERLYYSDPDLLEFDATILDTGQHGDHHYTTLDRSAFYPTSGGQLHDTGRLNQIKIVDVIEHGEKEVWHLSQDPVGQVADKVHGSVDRERRRRHQKQHTAQHILSQALVRLFEFETVSVHLGEDYGAIEINSGEITSEQLIRVQAHARQMVDDNLAVEILTVAAADIDSIPLRRESRRTGPLRVIKIGQFEFSACGGTHCRNTAEVGLIKILGIEKIRGHGLIKFIAGLQVADDYDMRFEATDRLSRSLTCHVNDLPERVDKIQQENRQLKMELTRVQKEMLPVLAGQLGETAVTVAETRLVFEQIDHYDNKLVNTLAAAVADTISGVAVIYLDGRLIVSASESCGRDARKIAAELSEKAGLKGGGSPRQSQLGGASWDERDQYLQIIQDLLING